MIKYLFFILIGIILYILSNNKDGFNIGVPEYQFTIEGELISQVDERARTSESEDVFEWDGDPIIYCVWAEDETGARRKLKRHTDLNMGVNTVNIDLVTPAVSVDQNDGNNITCEPNYNCNIVGNLNNNPNDPERDNTYDQCVYKFDNDDTENHVYNCKRYHTIDGCIQNCSFVNVNNPSKTLEKDGFQKISRRETQINVGFNITDDMEVDEESMDPNFRTFYTEGFEASVRNTPRLRYSSNGFSYSEYLFKLFIESIYPGSNLHKLRDGIYFINGKIIICRFSPNNLRIINIRTTKWKDLTPEQQAAATILDWIEDTWNSQTNDHSLFTTKNIWGDLATEAREGQEQSEQDAAITLGYDESTWGKDPPYSRFYSVSNRSFPILHMDLQKYITYDGVEDPYGSTDRADAIDGKTSKNHYNIQELKHGVRFESNENSKSINLWLLLQGSIGTKTLGFIDIIDDDDINKYNADTLRDMQANDLAIQKLNIPNWYTSQKYSMVEFPGRLTTYFQAGSVQFPNVLNIQTMDSTMDTQSNPDQSKPNINPNILYTYDMTPGDILAFRSDIPHIGFNDNRISLECRYDYIEINTSVNNYFFINKTKCAGGKFTDINKQAIYKELELYGYSAYSWSKADSDKIINKIYIFFDLIFQEFQKQSGTLSDSFFPFLEFLNSKLNCETLNLDPENNPDYDGSLTRLRHYIEEFLNTL